MTETERAGDAAARAQANSAARRKAAAVWAFQGLDDPAPEPAVALRASTGWACPSEHAAVVTLTSRAGRVYGMCGTCHAFEGRAA